MVMRLLLLLLTLSMQLFADISFSVEFDQSTLKTDQDISATITITTSAGEKVDPKSIYQNGTLLNAEVLSQTPTQTRIRVTLPPQGKGPHILDPIIFTANGKPYTTVPQTYNVSDSGTPPAKPQPAGTAGQSNNIWLKLEPVLDVKKQLYPGQRVTVGYRYYFNGNIQLEKEVLPLLEADGFKLIGEPNIQDVQDKQMALRQVTQDIEAVKPGEYQFAEATVSGYTYNIVNGQQVLSSQKITATAPPITIKVLAFPDEGKPASFNGAVGQYKFDVRLLSLPELSVGDKLTLAIDISGEGDLTDLPMPEVCCQPGFSGNFQQSDIPPVPVLRGSTKSFVVDLRPLSTSLKEIPSLEFSFFTPTTGKYTTLKSQPIPIRVYPPNGPFNQALEEANTPSKVASPVTAQPAAESYDVKPIDIAGNASMSNQDLQDSSFTGWWTVWLIPIALLILWYQINLERYKRQQLQATHQQESKKLFEEAEKLSNNPDEFLPKLEQALIDVLYEKKLIESPNLTPAELSDEGVVGDVKAFLLELEKQRFTQDKTQSTQEVLVQARKLYEDIRGYSR